jgi:MFS superfamily sulfate permease-like transporter
MGYTKISGTPVITGLYTILIPTALFAVFGSSRHQVVGADSATAAILAAALGIVIDIGHEYLEAPDCSNALAAVEIVAALRGHPIYDRPDNAKAWVEAHRELNV